MRAIILILSFTSVVLGSLSAQEFYVEASRSAIVRAEPDRESELRLRLEPGEQLNAVTGEQTHRFYHVFLPNGETGWVSRYVVRLHEGWAPDAPPVAVMPGVGGGLTAAERRYAEFHLAVGKPRGYKEIYREGFVIGYDPSLKIAAWVQYRLTRERSINDTFLRTDSFDEDVEVPSQARAALDDYAAVSSDYVRGHMAPADDMRWSRTAENESNLLTNVAPQIGATFNGSIWKTLENRVRRWVRDRGDLTIICGPVFEPRAHVRSIERQPRTERQVLYNVVGGSNVAVPTSFFKIVVDMRNPQYPDVLAFLVEHREVSSEDERRPETYLTSVDSIEVLTGLDFLPNLPHVVQEEIESAIPARIW